MIDVMIEFIIVPIGGSTYTLSDEVRQEIATRIAKGETHGIVADFPNSTVPTA